MHKPVRLTKKLINDSRFYVLTNFISNGHWLIHKKMISNQPAIGKLFDAYGEEKQDSHQWLMELMKNQSPPFRTKMIYFTEARNICDSPVAIFASEDGLSIACFQSQYVARLGIKELYMNRSNGIGCTIGNPLQGKHQMRNAPYLFLMPTRGDNEALATYRLLSGKRKAEWL